MESELFALAYVSRRNACKDGIGPEDEVRNILAASRRNNSLCSLTSGLMVSDVNYAQVIEGPRAAVENTFKKIQRDPRHRDVSVLYFKPAKEREFPDWRMAMKSLSDEAARCVDAAIADTHGAAADKIRAHLISGLGRMSAMRNEDAWQVAKVFLHTIAQASAVM